MNIAVIAANGRSGRAFVELALKEGHSIRAGAFNANDLQPSNNLEIVQCNATEPADVVKLLRGTDAVVSFIGHVPGSSARVQTDAMRVVVEEMRADGPRRIVSLTGTGVRFAGDHITLADRVLNAAVARIDPDRVNDGIEHADVLRGSGLDWTIIRVLKLQNFPSKPFVLKSAGPTRLYVNRGEVAHAVLDVLTHNSFVHEAPILSRS